MLPDARLLLPQLVQCGSLLCCHDASSYSRFNALRTLDILTSSSRAIWRLFRPAAASRRTASASTFFRPSPPARAR